MCLKFRNLKILKIWKFEMLIYWICLSNCLKKCWKLNEYALWSRENYISEDVSRENCISEDVGVRYARSARVFASAKSPAFAKIFRKLSDSIHNIFFSKKKIFLNFWMILMRIFVSIFSIFEKYSRGKYFWTFFHLPYMWNGMDIT